MSAGEPDIVLAALAFALGLLLAGWALPRAVRGFRHRSRRLLPNHRRRPAPHYEDFFRLVEQAGVLEESESNSGQRRRRRKPTYRRADNGQYTTETYAKQHPGAAFRCHD